MAKVNNEFFDELGVSAPVIALVNQRRGAVASAIRASAPVGLTANYKRGIVERGKIQNRRYVGLVVGRWVRRDEVAPAAPPDSLEDHDVRLAADLFLKVGNRGFSGEHADRFLQHSLIVTLRVVQLGLRLQEVGHEPAV